MSLRKVCGIMALAVILLAPACTQAQGTMPPSAPLPSAFATARKIFLGNAGDQQNADCLRAYNSFFADVNALGHYQMVFDPNQADVVLDLHYEIDSDNVGQDTGNTVRQFRVVLEDPHSRVVLWTLIERTNYAAFKKNRNKNQDEVIAKLARDVGSLLSQHPVAPNNDSITRHGTTMPLGEDPHE